VFAEFATEDRGFVRSRPVVKLFGWGLTFISRSEARRLMAGMDGFEQIDVDFAGVDDVVNCRDKTNPDHRSSK